MDPAVTERRVVENPVTNTQVHEAPQAPAKNLALGKTHEVIWFLTHTFAILLTLRFIFLIFGANLSGIVLFIYTITQPIVFMFNGIFPVVSTSTPGYSATFEMASLLAVAGVYLFTMLILGIIRLITNKTVAQTTTTVKEI